MSSTGGRSSSPTHRAARRSRTTSSRRWARTCAGATRTRTARSRRARRPIDVIAEAHRASADLLNADPDEVVFGPNATTLLFAISRSVARTLGPGDEVVVTRLDHDANVRPWVLAAEDSGATVRWVDVRETDVTLDLESFEAALSERTKVVAFTLASNAVGTITPAAELTRLVHERTPALVACDGVHLAQHRRIDVREIGADLIACSPYKIFGPHLGILFGRREVLSSLRPYKVRPADDALPYAFETGTQNHEGFAGWIAAVDYLAGLGDGGSRREAVARRVRARDRPVGGRALAGGSSTASRRSPRSACSASPGRIASTSARPPSRSGSGTSTPRRPRRRSPNEGSSSGTATTTRSRSWSVSASRTREGRSASASATTTRPTRSTGCSRSSPTLAR